MVYATLHAKPGDGGDTAYYFQYFDDAWPVGETRPVSQEQADALDAKYNHLWDGNPLFSFETPRSTPTAPSTPTPSAPTDSPASPASDA